MKEDKKSTKLISYTLVLKSRTSSLRIKEALEKLKSLYPYKLEKQNIKIRETGNKNEYLVYINEKGFPKDRKNLSIIFLTGVIILFCIAVFFLVKNYHEEKKQIAKEKKQIELEIDRKEKAEKELEEKILTLKEKVKYNEEQSCEKVYEKIELIYSLLKNNGTIENLFIENERFSLEVITQNSIRILSNFENSDQVTEVKLTRTTTQNKKEFVSISGGFVRNTVEIDENLPLREQVSLYEEKLSFYEKRILNQKKQTLSDYIMTLRNCMRKTHCQEQYIQMKGESDNREVELLVYSTATEILSFLKQIQAGEDNLFDIKTLRIRNSENLNNIQTLILFNTGIPIRNSEERNFQEETREEYSPEEISKSLKKEKPEEKKKTVPQANTEKKIENVKEVKRKPLSYVGQSKIGMTNYLIAKDEQMNILYKFEIADENSPGNICFLDSNGNYLARYNKEFYEVKK